MCFISVTRVIKRFLLGRMISIPVLLVLVMQGCADSEQLIKQQGCVTLLPQEAREKIVTSFRNWRTLELKDLVPDDQVLWKKYHQGECPGVAAGSFDNSGKTEYAVLIISRTQIKKQTKLLLLRKTYSGDYTPKILYEEEGVSNFPAIHKEPPGVYSDFYDRNSTIAAKTDVIIYEHIEASAIAFYYENGEFKQILISD